MNPLDSGATLADLNVVIGGQPDGIIQPKTDTPDCVRTLSRYLDAFETQHGLNAGAVKIVPVATETATAPFHLGAFSSAGLDRLAGLTWVRLSDGAIRNGYSLRLLNRGARLTELLKQDQYSPLKMEEQVAVIWAGTNGYLDKLAINQVGKFEAELLRSLRASKSLLEAIRKEEKLSDDSETLLKEAIQSVKNRMV